MIKRILAPAALGALLVSGTTAAQAAQGTRTSRLAATERITLQSEGRSLAHGTAVLTYSFFTHATKVVLTVTGLAKGTHLAHIHLGASCTSNGAVKYPLTSPVSMGVGSVEMSTTVIHANVLHKAMYINVHGTSRSVMQVVACGALSGSAM